MIYLMSDTQGGDLPIPRTTVRVFDNIKEKLND